MNKPELISFSDFLMIASTYDLRQFFAPEMEHIKNGLDGLLQSGLITEEKNPLIEYKDRVAVLSIDGPLRPGRGWYFGVGYGDVQDAIVELIDSDIDTVIQYLNTPGGTVKQAFETEEMFYELAKEKQLISAIDMATSAGALMTFPAKERYLLSKTAQTGSIGVVAEHVDNRIWYKEFWGEIRTSVAKGELKDAGTDTRGFDDKAKLVFSESVTKLHSIFVESASKGLGKSFEEIDAQQSRVFIGEDGIAAGFAQGTATLKQLIEKFNTDNNTFTTPGRPAFSNIQTEDNSMDITKLEAEFPDVYNAVLNRGKALGEKVSNETAVNEGKAAGILAERARITGIEALSMPAEFTAKAKAEDWSPEKAAAEYLKAEAEKKKNIAANMESDASEPLESDAPAEPTEPDAQNDSNPVDDYKAEIAKHIEAGKTEGQAMKLVKNQKPELHQKYLDAYNKGGK